MNNAQPKAASGGAAPATTNLFTFRVVVGIVQGILLYFLVEVARSQYSAMPPIVFFPSLLVILYIAPVIEMSVGRLRTSRLVLWAAVLAFIVETLAFHDAWRTIEPPFAGHALGHARGDRFPSFQVTLFSGEFVFTGYVLVLAGETARTWFAPYETYFELGWRVALQIWFSSMFVAIFYLVLWIGAALFILVKLSFFQELLKQSWFYIPVSAMAFAVGPYYGRAKRFHSWRAYDIADANVVATAAARVDRCRVSHGSPVHRAQDCSSHCGKRGLLPVFYYALQH